jgi:hypothetical protein
LNGATPLESDTEKVVFSPRPIELGETLKSLIAGLRSEVAITLTLSEAMFTR